MHLHLRTVPCAEVRAPCSLRRPSWPTAASFALAASAACALGAGCERAAYGPSLADNLLLVSLDTTRADRLTPYGYSAATSPRVAQLVARGVLFERAYTHVPSTLPAHATIMTGLLPPAHGVRCNGKFRLGDAHRTLAEILSSAGFKTAATVGGFPLDARFGLAQGFDHYDDDFASTVITAQGRTGRMDAPGFWIGHDYADFERGAEEVSDAAIAWLETEAAGAQRWFLFAHFFDPHWPYEPPAEQAARFDDPYDAEIAYTDHHVGRLLDAAAALPGRTLVVLTADHGEGLGEHGERRHNRYLYNSTLHVPLIVALEGSAKPGTRVALPVGHVDILPTTLELLGVEPPAGLQGRSLAPLLSGEGAALAPVPVYAETLVWSLERPMGIEVRALVDEGAKLIHTRVARVSGRAREHDLVELYDLESDFAERRDRSGIDANLAGRLAAALDDERRRLSALAPAPEPLALDERARARLEALGYL